MISLRSTSALALLATLLLGLWAPANAQAKKIKVVASITDLASIAATVGGDRVEVASISRPSGDVHRVEVLPSYMVRVSKAQVYLKVGLSLDQWADQIIDGSRNAKLAIVDCSRNIDPLDKPTGRVDARQGDVHPNGNPHYWLDPHNGAIVARNIAEALGRMDPAHAAEFMSRAETLAAVCEQRRAEAVALIDQLDVEEILTYHSSWVYFAHATGLTVVGTVEPVPGIPPTGRHLQELVDLVQQRRLKVLLQEPYFSDEAPDFLARQTGIRVEKVSPSCDNNDPGSYLAHFDALVTAVTGN
jgi:ABC-type Zn uptake system ZnuABC Zn-binding protein ZnuA